MITIVDYGVGNIQALLNMYDHLGIDARSSDEPNAIARAERLLLPGVGAFDKAMRALNERELIPALEHAVHRRRAPILGICLGMQLLARNSDEGTQPGLGWIAADVKRIEVPRDSELKVPHMGWGEVTPTRLSPLFQNGPRLDRFYFVHGYHVVCDSPDDILATVGFGTQLCCAVNRANVWGVQFHPEKSHYFGMHLLKAFANLEIEVTRTDVE
jgi:glutamine amidotransferase